MKIKRAIANAFENDFLDMYQPTHLPQLVKSVSRDAQLQVDFSRIPVHARSGLSVVMEKHNEIKEEGLPHQVELVWKTRMSLYSFQADNGNCKYIFQNMKYCIILTLSN